jgi:hypothetical protein
MTALSRLYEEYERISVTVLERVKNYDPRFECWMGCGEMREMVFLPDNQGSFLSIYCKAHQRAPEVLARVRREE